MSKMIRVVECGDIGIVSNIAYTSRYVGIDKTEDGEIYDVYYDFDGKYVAFNNDGLDDNIIPKRTDKEIVNDIFKELRKNGFKAKQNWDCNKATQAEQDSDSILWTDRESKEKGYETYCEGYFQHGRLQISHNLSKENFIKALDIIKQFGLEVTTGSMEDDGWKWKCITLKTQGCKIRQMIQFKSAYDQLVNNDEHKDDKDVQAFLWVCKSHVNRRDIEKAGWKWNTLKWRKQIIK